MDLNIKKLTQLNEKVLIDGVEKYNILYPETIPSQIITDALHRFVTDAQIESWTNGGTYGLCWRGVYSSQGWSKTEGTTTTYHRYNKNDVVYYLPENWSDTSGGRYFISIADNHTQAPSMTDNTSYWRNIDLSAYVATNANNVKNSIATSGRIYLAGVNNYSTTEASRYDSLYIKDSIYFDVANNKLVASKFEGNFSGNLTGNVTGNVTGNLTGTAEKTEKYVTYAVYQNTNKNARHYTTDASLVGTIDTVDREALSSTYVDDAIRSIQAGAATTTLAHPLTLQKDGVQVGKYDNSTDLTFNVKQTYNVNDIGNLLNTDGKINTNLLPDSVLGQLEYQGTWNPSTKGTVSKAKGYFWIAATSAGNYAPDGTLMSASATTVPEYYQIGDWAVYNGTSWDKVDNTDAVRTVNNRIGDVQIYQTYTGGNHYYRGDIVKVEGVLYIANTEITSASTNINTNYWDIFGRTYTASDGIKIEGTVIKHSTSVTPGSSTTKTISTASGENKFTVPNITLDAYGHATKIDTIEYSLGSDFVNTFRPVYINDTQVLTAGDKKNLVLNGDSWITMNYSNNKLNFVHKAITTIPDLNSGKITDSQESDDILYAGQGYSIPNITVDAAGHISVGSLKRFRLASNSFTHSHFNITTTNNIQNIEAYDATTATSAWVGTVANAKKFYLGGVNPTQSDRMNLNANLYAHELFQGAGKKVVDETLRFYGGTDVNGNALYGGYDKSTGVLTAPDSGSGAGVFSAVQVNSKGIVTAGGQIVEFGTTEGADPSAALAVGGLFFRLMGTVA